MKKRSELPYFVKKINNAPKKLENPMETHYSNIISYQDSVYLNYKNDFFRLQINGLISTDESDFSWIPIIGSPLNERSGQSMTSTSKGIVFYGGEDFSHTIYDDLWIFDGKEWSFLSPSIPPLAYHAACFDGKESLIIHGGTLVISKKVVYSPANIFYCINLSTGYVNKIELSIPSFPKSIFRHSIVRLHTGKFCIFGGKSDVNTVLDSFFYFTLDPNAIEEVNMPFKLPIYAHKCVEIYNLLFVTGGKGKDRNDYKFPWIFDISHQIWFEFKTVRFDCIFSFTSQSISSNNIIHFISQSYNQLLSYTVFKQSQSTDLLSNQEYYNFLVPILKKGMESFKTDQLKHIENNNIETLMKQILQIGRDKFSFSETLIQEGVKNKTQYDQLLSLQFRLASFNYNLVSKQDTKSQLYKNEKDSNSSITVKEPKELIRKYKSNLIQSKEELKKATKEAKQLSLQADHLEMQFLKNSLKNSQQEINTTENDLLIEQFQQKCLKCKQMAHLISSYKKENSSLKKNYRENKQNYKHYKLSTLTLLDQYCMILQQQANLKQKDYDIKNHCLEATRDILSRRIDIMNVNMSKSSSELQELLNIAHTPEMTHNLSSLHSKQIQVKDAIKNDLTHLFKEQKSTNIIKNINDISSQLENLSSWMKACKTAIPDIPNDPINLNDANNNKFVTVSDTKFIDSLFRCDTLDIEIQRLTNQLKLN